MPDNDRSEAPPPEPENTGLARPTDGDSIQGSGRAVEKGYELVTDDPPPVNQTTPSGDGPPVDLPADAPAGDE